MSNIGKVSTSSFFNNMSETTVAQEAVLYNTQAQLSSGKKINQPSDDPLSAAQLSIIKNQIAQNSTYSTTIGAANQAIQMASSSASDALGELQNVYQLAVQARNGSYGASDLKNLGSTLSGILSSLTQTANATDGQGNYLFSGAQSGTQPFQFNGTNYIYSGDQTVAYARTSPATLTQTSWTGASLFQGGLSGDGAVDAAATGTNSGNGVIANIIQSSPGSYNGHNYSVAFSQTGNQLQTTITDTTTSTVVSGPSNFTNGQAISFAGVNLTITGTPVAGDSFTVSPAVKVNALDAVAQLTNALNNSGSLTQSQLGNVLASAQRAISSSITNLTSESALMGSEINSLGTQLTTTQNQGISLESSRSSLEDVDMAKAITDFTAQKTALTASLQSFAAISGLSLFNYLK